MWQAQRRKKEIAIVHNIPSRSQIHDVKIDTKTNLGSSRVRVDQSWHALIGLANND